MKVLKFETIINDVQDVLKRDIRKSGFEDVKVGATEKLDANTHLFFNPALGLIYDYEKLNDYGKVIMDHSRLYITDGYNSYKDIWTPKYQTMNNFNDFKVKLDVSKEFIKLCRLNDNYGEAHKFIFWAMLILTVDKNIQEEKLSLICDFTQMLKISYDEVLDILLVVKIVLHEEKYKFNLKALKANGFKTFSMDALFARMLNLLY